MGTSGPLHSFLRDLLQSVEMSEIISDNAVTPTRTLRAQQRRRARRKMKKDRSYRSSSASPSIRNSKNRKSLTETTTTTAATTTTTATTDERRLKWQQQEAESYSFESPVRRKKSSFTASSWKRATESPRSVALLSPLSPKSARWSPQAAAFSHEGADEGEKQVWDSMSPKSARWNVQSPPSSCMVKPPSSCLVRQKSDSLLLRSELPTCCVLGDE